MSDTNVHRVVGNLLVGTSHFFVDTTTNQVGVNTSTPGAALDVQGGDVKVGSGITLASSTGTITATGFSGNGSGLTGVNSDSGSWVNGSSSNIHLAVSTDNVGIGVVDPDGPLHLVLPATSNYTGFTYQSGDVKTVFGNTGDDSTNTSFVQVYAGVTNSVPDTNSGTYNLALQPHGGNVGVGTVSPSSTLHVAGGRVNIERFDDTTSIFTGLLGPNTDGGRSQLVLSSAYSDLVIASSRVNQNHGSTISFVTYDPSNVSDYRKFVINQGNWGARKEFLDFGLSSGTLDANPHLAINGTDTVLTLDGTNKRVGIGKDVPATKLDVGGRIYGSGTVVQVRDRYMQSFWNTTSGYSNGDIPQSLETGVKWNITPTKTSSRILVNFKFIAYFSGMNGSSNGARCQIWRKIGSTYSRVYGISGSYHDLHYYSVIQNHHAYIPISFVDSPGTTSVVEYALRARMYSQVGTMYIGNGGHQPVTIQLMEIGG